MKYAINHHATIKDCKLKVKNIDRWRSSLMTLNDKDVIITIVQEKDYRTLPQNRFYWLYLSIISEETGENENDLHDLFKRKFLPPRFKKILGQDVKLPASTTELDKLEMSNYMSQIEMLTGVPIPNLEV